MIITTHTDSFGLVVTVTGRFDAHVADLFRSQVHHLVAGERDYVTLDLRGVPFIDIEGVREVRALNRRLTSCGCAFRIFPSDSVMVTFGFLDLGRQLDAVA